MSRFLATTDDLADGPPPEVLAQVDVAWERARDLFSAGLELHFEVGADGVWAELRCADGGVAERFTASEALDIACGDAELRFPVAA